MLIDQIKAWCQAVGNTVIIRPVIDLNTQISTNAYTPTEKLVEQVRLRDQVCVFPHCPRRARWCDLDHRTPYDKTDPTAGGPTATQNLALLCRRHHRAKTFSPWTYSPPNPGSTTGPAPPDSATASPADAATDASPSPPPSKNPEHQAPTPRPTSGDIGTSTPTGG